MNITNRINARKIVLAYAYWLFFLQYYRNGADLEAYTTTLHRASLDEDDTAFLEGVGIDAQQLEQQEVDVPVDRKTFDNTGVFEDDIAMIADGLGMAIHTVDREYVILV